MAVTQNLARAGARLLDECRQSTEVLADVCSSRRLPAHDYLDVDWAPALLIAAAEADGLTALERDCLRRALEGDTELNPAYRDVADSIWEHPVTVVVPGGVSEISRVLTRVVGSQFPSPDAVDAALDKWPERPSEPHAYLRRQAEAVAAFYDVATQHRMGVLAWWD